MNWYYARGEERMGPVDDGEMLELAASGAITSQTLVWREGMADWAPWGQAPHPHRPDAPYTGAPATFDAAPGLAPCVECGRAFAADEMVVYGDMHVCAECKPIFFQRLRESGQRWEMNYAGFWIRFCARFVDGVLMLFVNGLLSVLQVAVLGAFNPNPGAADVGLSILFTIISLLIPLAYETWFVGRFAATPGKMIMRLKVVRSDGARVTYSRAAGRYLGVWLSWLTLTIGFIIAAFDEQKRALQDHICDTRVIHQ